MPLATASLPFRFFTPFPHRPSRRSRNSARSIMPIPICPLFIKWHLLLICFVLKHLDRPTSSASLKDGSGRLNLQRSLHPFPKTLKVQSCITELEMLPFLPKIADSTMTGPIRHLYRQYWVFKHLLLTRVKRENKMRNQG